MNFLKKIYSVEEQSKSFNQEDIALLAFMAVMCAPDIVVGFFKRHYAYYVPRYNCDLEIAKSIFEKNGVKVRVHFSHIYTSKGQDVLRLNYKCSKNYNYDRMFFKKISKEHGRLIPVEEDDRLGQKVAELRQNNFSKQK